jgi:radical SAM enzyme (TIGR01210 family)
VKPLPEAEVEATYPAAYRERVEWIRARRGPRETVDPWRPYAFLVEDECTASGKIVPTATIFLTNRECPWTCLMCDLWRNTLTNTVPPGAIPAQIDHALAALPEARQVKLYNAGSFFDPRAIPPEDYSLIAERVRGFERVIVECHPALINDRILGFRDLLGSELEIAMGLETAHPGVLEKLNKGMTLDRFNTAAAFLRRNGITLRSFVLVQPPFLDPSESLAWVQRSIEFACDAGADTVALIPTRAGNGALDSLAAHGRFAEPKLSALEDAMNAALRLKRGLILADLWDLRRFSTCLHCLPARRNRLHEMNLRQVILPDVKCAVCDD